MEGRQERRQMRGWRGSRKDKKYLKGRREREGGTRKEVEERKNEGGGRYE